MDNPKMLQYYVVYDWMLSELGLDITERNIFAYVLAWNLQEMTYYASKATTAAFFGVSERKVAYVFDKLTKAKLLISQAEKMPQGNRRIHYVISQEVAAKYAVAQLHKLQLVYAKFAVAQLQNLQKIDNNITDEYPEGYSKKDKDNDVPADAGTKATADAPAVSVPVPDTQTQEVEKVEVSQPTLFEEGEGIIPGMLPIDKKPTRKEKSSAKKEKKSADLTPTEFTAWQEERGVSHERAAEWAEFRRKNRCPNSPRALKPIEKAFKELEAEGITPDQAVEIALTIDPANGKMKSWETLTAEWVRSYLARVNSGNQRPAAGPVPLQPVGGYSRPAPMPAPAETRYERIKRIDAEGDEMIDRLFNN